MEDKPEENTIGDRVNQYNDMLRIKTGKVLKVEENPNDAVLMKVSFVLLYNG